MIKVIKYLNMKIKLSLIELKLIVFIQLKFKSLAITKMKLRNLHRKGLRKVKFTCRSACIAKFSLFKYLLHELIRIGNQIMKSF